MSDVPIKNKGCHENSRDWLLLKQDLNFFIYASLFITITKTDKREIERIVGKSHAPPNE